MMTILARGIPRQAEVPLEALLDALKNQPDLEWQPAFEGFRNALGWGPQVDWPPPDGLANWVWLTSIQHLGSIMDLGSPLGELAAGMVGTFERVNFIGSESIHTDVVEERLKRIPLGAATVVSDPRPVNSNEGSADCVVIDLAEGWRQRLPSWISGAEGVAGLAAHFLNGTGSLVVMRPNPWGLSRLIRSGASSLTPLRIDWAARRLARGMKRRGFTSRRRYYVAPDPGLPEMLVPARGSVVRAWGEFSLAPGGAHKLLRGLAPWCVFPHLLEIFER